MTTSNPIKFFPLLAALSVPLAVEAAPVVSNVSGAADAGKTITVSGSGFGSGPNVVIFDDFEGGTAGATHPGGAARIGTWNSSNLNPLFDSTAFSGKASARIFDSKGMRQLQSALPAGTTQVFASLWVQVPPGTLFPGDATSSRDFGSRSSWKMTWFMDSSYDGSSSDICAPTHAGNGSFALAGNDLLVAYLKSGSTWWVWDNWMRVSVWMSASSTSPTSAGNYEFHVASPTRAQYRETGSEQIFDADGPTKKQFQQVNVPGWLIGGANTRPVYDDVYIASGPNARARVEIGDAATYTSSKSLVIVPTTSWADGRIEAKVFSTMPIPTANRYVYVTNAAGQRNENGVRVCTTCVVPDPPTSVSVQ